MSEKVLTEKEKETLVNFYKKLKKMPQEKQDEFWEAMRKHNEGK